MPALVWHGGDRGQIEVRYSLPLRTATRALAPTRRSVLALLLGGIAWLWLHHRPLRTEGLLVGVGAAAPRLEPRGTPPLPPLSPPVSADAMPRRRVRERRRRQGDRSKWSNPFELAERVPPVVREVLSPLSTPSCGASAGGAPAVPNVVHQAWFGGGKLMFAKLLSVLSVRYLLRPHSHLLHYDEEPSDALEWRCACRLATCVQATPRTRALGRTLEHATLASDRYASDRTGKCGSATLDLFRIDTLLPKGGAFLDLDVFALREMAPWRRCAASAILGTDFRGQLGAGVLLASPRSAFLQRWRASFREYDPATWEHGACNSTTALAAGAPPSDVHAAAELGPLPRYKTRRAYDAHIDAAPLVHLSAFRHPWRLHDVMNMRHLEAVWARVAAAINASGASDPADPTVADPLVRQCVAKIAGACWARPGHSCGIYGA